MWALHAGYLAEEPERLYENLCLDHFSCGLNRARIGNVAIAGSPENRGIKRRIVVDTCLDY
jgi:hypothetical protein